MPCSALCNRTVVFREGRNRQRDTEARGLLTHDTTRPLKQGSLALSSEISSFTTLQRREEAVRAGSGTSERKETLLGGCLHPATGSPGLGMGQLPPAARLELPMPTATTGRLEGRRQGQNRLPCVHPAVLSPDSHFNQLKKKFTSIFLPVRLLLKKYII